MRKLLLGSDLLQMQTMFKLAKIRYKIERTKERYCVMLEGHSGGGLNLVNGYSPDGGRYCADFTFDSTGKLLYVKMGKVL